MSQLVLNVGREDHASFENFYPGANRQLLEYLKALTALSQTVSARFVYLWGQSGAGKTHLLHALNQVVLPTKKSHWFDPSISNSSMAKWVFVDDVQKLSSAAEQQALLTSYDAIKQRTGVMVLTANKPPTELDLSLPDLVSRLSAAEVFEVALLDDTQRREALRARAALRGFSLSDEVLSWLLGHASRDMGDLLTVLDRLDTTTLVEQRKVTLPLVKKVMSQLEVAG